MSLQRRNSNVYGHRQLYAHHSVYGYTFTPMLNARCISRDPELGGFRIITDDLGFRNSSPLKDNSNRDCIDFLLLGCSFAAGHGVNNESRFSDIFQAAVPNSNVYNAALSGSGMDQQFLIAEDFVRKKIVKKIIFSPYPGCANRNLMTERPYYDPFLGRYCGRPKPFFKIVGDDLRLCELPIKKWGSLMALEARVSFTNKLFANFNAQMNEMLVTKFGIEISSSQSTYNGKNQTGNALLTKILLKLLDLCKLHNIELIIMPLPARYDLFANKSPAYNLFFQSFSNEKKLQMFDLWSYLKSFPKHQLENFFIKNDGHYTKLGHQVVASYVTKCIQAQ